ncbi:MAG TPA: CsbD family protein [Longimicrobiales bacterium]
MADELTGKIKHVGGKIQEEVGEFLGDKKMKRDGKLSQIEGEAEQDLERAADAVEEAAARKNAAKIAKESDI